MESKIQNLFQDSDETVVNILGHDSLDKILSNKNINKSIVVLTNRRMYQKGIIYEKTLNNKFSRHRGLKVINIEDIKGTSYINPKKKILSLVLACLLTLYLVQATLNISFYHRETIITWGLMMLLGQFVILIAAVLLCIFFWYRYIKSTLNLFVIEYSGGSIAFNLEWFKKDEVENFKKSIFYEQENFKSDSNSNLKICKFCAERIQINAKVCRYCNRDQ